MVAGFLAPIAQAPLVNEGRAGRTYPVKWRLTTTSGEPLGDLAAVSSIRYQSVSCTSLGTASSDLPAASTGGTSLRYDNLSNQYVYNWATPNTAGCYRLNLTLASGQVFAASFNLR